MRVREKVYIGARLVPGRPPMMSQRSMRLDEEAVRTLVGSRYARAGETATQGWERAGEQHGWVVVELLIEGTLQ